MNNKQISILLGVTVAIGGTAYFMNNKRQASTEAYSSSASAAIGQPLFADLKNSVNNISTIVQTKPDKSVTTVQKQGEDWVIAEKNNFPAATHEVRKLLLGLANAKIIEAKTQNKDNYGKLGVNDITETGASGVQYAVKDASGKEVANIIVGNTGAQRADNAATSYIRKSSDKQTWLVSGELKGPADIATWLQRDIINIDVSRMQSVEIKKHGAATPTVVQKKARTDASYDVGTIPEGKELSSADTPNTVASALSNLQLDDVAAEKDVTVPAEVSTTTFKTFDGMVVTATTFKANDKNWLKLAASYDEAQATQFAPPPEANKPAETKPEANAPAADAAKPTETASPTAESAKTDAVATGPKPEDVKKEIEELNKRATGWVYAIAPFKLENMTRTLDSMLQDKAKPAENGAAAAPNASDNDKLKAELGH